MPPGNGLRGRVWRGRRRCLWRNSSASGVISATLVVGRAKSRNASYNYHFEILLLCCLLPQRSSQSAGAGKLAASLAADAPQRGDTTEPGELPAAVAGCFSVEPNRQSVRYLAVGLRRFLSD